VFRITAELLHSSDTRVRCGECYAIFDALANLVDDGLVDDRSRDDGSGDSGPGDSGPGDDGPAGGPDASSAARDDEAAQRTAIAASLAGLTNDTAALDVTYSDFDLFSEDAELPEVAYLDQTRDTPEFDFDSVEPEDEERFNDTLFAADMTVDVGRGVPILDADDPRAEQPTGRAELPRRPLELDATSRIDLDFRYRDPEPDPVDDPSAGAPAIDALQPGPAPEVDFEITDAAPAVPAPFEQAPGRGGWRLPVIASVALLVLVAGLHGYRQRQALHEDPFTRPVYEAVCRITGCTVPMRSALDRIDLLERQMFSHPTLPDALVIDVAFRNAAGFEQALPALSVQLSDPGGRLVAQRIFQPDEYLAGRDGPSAHAPMEPDARLRVSLDVDDPGQDAASFMIEFVPSDR